jgi:hypothetical protein
VTANGGDGGPGGGGGDHGGGGGGGGSISFYAQQYDAGLNFTTTAGANGYNTAATNGNFWLTEINHAGTALGTKHVNTNASWNNS